MRKYRSGTRWGVWLWSEVVIGGETYLRRLHLLKTPWGAVMIHWILRADPQPHLHDHPVSFLSFVVRGGYQETRPRDRYEYAGRCFDFRSQWVTTWNWIAARDTHRIIDVLPGTITLCFAGPARQVWGFYTPEGKIAWTGYDSEAEIAAAGRPEWELAS